MSAVEPRSGDGQRERTALILSAGAPHSPLMAGALYAIHRRRRLEGKLKNGTLFDIIYTSGAGALIGLLLAAPKSKDPKDLEAPEKALKSVLELAVSDPIYSMLPINYKAFLKPGPFTRPLQRMARLFKLGEYPFLPVDEPRSPLGQWYNHWVEVGRGWVHDNEANRRLFNDLIDLWTAVITPTTLTFWSKGVCEPLPFIEDFVDFKRLNEEKGDFYLNFLTPRDLVQQDGPLGQRQYRPKPTESGRSGTGAAMRLLQRENIKAEHVRAAFAYPFIYEPVRVPPDSALAFEGANWEPISFGNLLEKGVIQAREIKTVVLVDILSMLEPFMLREPRNLWDAFGLLIIFPAVAHARKELSRFELDVDENGYNTRYGFYFRKVKFDLDLDENDGAHILDWSYSNMSRMFDKGREAGEDFCRKYWDDL